MQRRKRRNKQSGRLYFDWKRFGFRRLMTAAFSCMLLFVGGDRTQAVFAAEELSPRYWPVLDAAGIHAEYLCGLNISNGRRQDVFRVTSSADEDLLFELSDIRLNGTILTDAQETVGIDSGEEIEVDSEKLTETILLAEQDGAQVRNVSGTAGVYSWEQDENGEQILLEEAHFSIDYPTGWIPELICEASHEMRAAPQAIAEKDGVKISLEGCGAYLGSTYDISGILRIENTSGKTIPYAISCAELNGHTVEVYLEGPRQGQIPDGACRYLLFRIPDDELESNRIESISEMRLQILTDPEQDTGTFHRAGGVWYPLELAQHGNPDETFDLGEVIYEDDWIRLGYVGGQVDWNEGTDWYQAYGACYWNLAVENKTDENVELALKDYQINGAETEGFGNAPALTEDTVGAHSRRYVSISKNLEEEMLLPELSFRLQVRKQGGGALLNDSGEIVTLPGETAVEELLSESDDLFSAYDD